MYENVWFYSVDVTNLSSFLCLLLSENCKTQIFVGKLRTSLQVRGESALQWKKRRGWGERR